MNFIYHVCVELIVAGMVVSVGVCVCVCVRNFLVDCVLMYVIYLVSLTFQSTRNSDLGEATVYSYPSMQTLVSYLISFTSHLNCSDVSTFIHKYGNLSASSIDVIASSTTALVVGRSMLRSLAYRGKICCWYSSSISISMGWIYTVSEPNNSAIMSCGLCILISVQCCCYLS